MECAKRGKNQDTVQLYPDKLLKKIKNKNKNVNINIIKIALPSARKQRDVRKVREVAKHLPLGQQARFQTQGHRFGNIPQAFNINSYSQPSSAIQPVYHVSGSQEAIKKSFYDMGRKTRDDFTQTTNPIGIVPDLTPSIRAVPSTPTANPYDLDMSTKLIEMIDTPVPVGKHPELFNSLYKAPVLYATLTDDDEPVEYNEVYNEQAEASEWIYKDVDEESAVQAESVLEPPEMKEEAVLPVRAEPAEAPGVNPKYLGERALPKGLWKSATKGRYYVMDTTSGRKVRTDAKGNPLVQ